MSDPVQIAGKRKRASTYTQWDLSGLVVLYLSHSTFFFSPTPACAIFLLGVNT